jgi:hypothetical protein
MLTTHGFDSKREGDRWSHVLTINDRAIYLLFMEDTRKDKNYRTLPMFSTVELEGEMENLWTWTSYMSGHEHFAIGNVKKLPER